MSEAVCYLVEWTNGQIIEEENEFEFLGLILEKHESMEKDTQDMCREG